MKNRVRLTESQLHAVIKEAVKAVLREKSEEDEKKGHKPESLAMMNMSARWNEFQKQHKAKGKNTANCLGCGGGCGNPHAHDKKSTYSPEPIEVSFGEDGKPRKRK